MGACRTYPFASEFPVGSRTPNLDVVAVLSLVVTAEFPAEPEDDVRQQRHAIFLFYRGLHSVSAYVIDGAFLHQLELVFSAAELGTENLAVYSN